MQIKFPTPSNSPIDNCKSYDARRNVERMLATRFDVSNHSSDIPAGHEVLHLLEYQCNHIW